MSKPCETCGKSPSKKIIRNEDTKENKAFWNSIEKAATPCDNRPDYLNAFYKSDEVCPNCNAFLGYTSSILGIY